MKLVVFLDQILNIDELMILLNTMYKSFKDFESHKAVAKGEIKAPDLFGLDKLPQVIKENFSGSDFLNEIFTEQFLEIFKTNFNSDFANQVFTEQSIIVFRDHIDELIAECINSANMGILNILHGDGFSDLDQKDKITEVDSNLKIFLHTHIYYLLIKLVIFLNKILNSKHQLESVVVIWPDNFISTIDRFDKKKKKQFIQQYSFKNFLELDDVLNNDNMPRELFLNFYSASRISLLLNKMIILIGEANTPHEKYLKFIEIIMNEFLLDNETRIDHYEQILGLKIDFRKQSFFLSDDFSNGGEFNFIIQGLPLDIEKKYVMRHNYGIIDVNSSIVFNKDFFFIRKKIKHDIEKGNNYNLEFTEALDPQLSEILNVMIENEAPENYAYLICDDKFICTKIIEELKQKLKFTEHDLSDGIRIEYLNDDLNIFINFNKLENKKQRELWNKVVDKKSLVKKTVFIDTQVPKNGLINLNSFTVWNYDYSLVKKRLSLIFHQLIPPRSKTPVSNSTVKRIRENYYRDLIQVTEEINIKSISDSLNHALLQGNKFNYSSIEDWFIFRKHLKLIDNPKSKTSNSPEIEKITIEIIYDVTKDKYAQISLGKNYIKGEVKKSLFIIMIVLKYWQLFNKGIDHTHLFIIANEYLKRKDSEQKIIERINNEIEPKLDYAAIHSAIMGEGVKNIDRRLKDFVKDHFKMSSTKVTFTPNLKQNNKNIQYFINADKFNIDVKLLSDNYISILQKKYSK